MTDETTPATAVPYVPKAELEAWETHFYALKGRTNKRIAELNAELATARNEALEKAERVCLNRAAAFKNFGLDDDHKHCLTIAEDIRALKTPEGDG